MIALQRLLNRLWVFTICGILMGGYIYQFIKHEEPCPLCMLQRLAMFGVAAGVLLNLRFGFKEEHYGLDLLASFFGLIVSLRQIALHVCPQFPTFGEPILNYDLYVWSFFVFMCSIFATSVLLMIHLFIHQKPARPVWAFWDKLAFALVLLLALANTITTLIQCGLSPCQG